MIAAFTIGYNCLHHLKHRWFAEFMVDYFDLWIFVEGFAHNGGSTGWCNYLELPANSTDGTISFMEEMADRHENLLFYSPSKPWASKDDMVKSVVEILKTKTEETILWQVDADEIWTKDKLDKNNQVFLQHNSNCGAVCFNHIVGKSDDKLLVSRGTWGSSAVNRVWKWQGEDFIMHEPAIMENQKKPIVLPSKFDHYSMYFKRDVEFKSKYYKGYEKLVEKWENLQRETEFPVRASALVPNVKGARFSKIHRELRG